MNTSHHIFPREGLAPPKANQAKLLYITCAQYSQEWNSTIHTHSCAELFFVTSGRGLFQLQHESFPVAVSDLVLVNAGVPHTELSQEGSPMEYIVLGVEGLEVLTDTGAYALSHITSGWDELTTCLRLMLHESRSSRTGYHLICQHLLDIILLHLQRQDGLAIASSQPGHKVSRECDLVRRYIDSHFKENLTLDQLSAIAHINKYYLVHAFRKEYNISPISYLITRRTQESRFLLSNTDYTLSQIAQILGFSSPSYFSQSFRRLEGISPMEYRKRYRHAQERHT